MTEEEGGVEWKDVGGGDEASPGVVGFAPNAEAELSGWKQGTGWGKAAAIERVTIEEIL